MYGSHKTQSRLKRNGVIFRVKKKKSVIMIIIINNKKWTSFLWIVESFGIGQIKINKNIMYIYI